MRFYRIISFHVFKTKIFTILRQKLHSITFMHTMLLLSFYDSWKILENALRLINWNYWIRLQFPASLNLIARTTRVYCACMHVYGRKTRSILGVAKFFYYRITIGLDDRGRFVIEIREEKEERMEKGRFREWRIADFNGPLLKLRLFAAWKRKSIPSLVLRSRPFNSSLSSSRRVSLSKFSSSTIFVKKTKKKLVFWNVSTTVLHLQRRKCHAYTELRWNRKCKSLSINTCACSFPFLSTSVPFLPFSPSHSVGFLIALWKWINGMHQYADVFRSTAAITQGPF